MGILDKLKKKDEEEEKKEELVGGEDKGLGLQEGEAEEVTSSTHTGVMGDDDLEEIKERLKAIQRMGRH